MLEWYEAYADYADTMARIETLVERVAREVHGHDGRDIPGPRDRSEGALGAAPVRRRARASTSCGRATRPSCGRGSTSEAWTPTPTRTGRSCRPRVLALRRAAGSSSRRSSTTIPSSSRRSRGRPTRTRRSTERFEYFAGGMELGNAFTEINDAEEQAARFDAAVRARRGRARRPRLRRGARVRDAADGRPRPRHRPAGDAADGRETIRDVILFPALRAVRDLSRSLPSGGGWRSPPRLVR